MKVIVSLSRLVQLTKTRRDTVLHRLRNELKTKTKVTGFGVPTHIFAVTEGCGLATAIDPEVVRKPVLAHS